jgi:glycosyl transferase family 87
MTKERFDGLMLLLLGALAFVITGIAWKNVSPIEMGDFKVVYYSARCLIQNGDPYSQADVLRIYRAEGREPLVESQVDRKVKTRFFYPPTAFIVTVPFALMGYGAGKILWMIVSAGCLILASTLTWDMAADFAPLLSGAMLGFLLMNSFWLFMIGNAAGIAVSFCVIAVWCFIRDRFVLAGIVCLAISLALKPNDSGLVWLLFLLAGGVLRKRAIQTLAVLVVLSVPVVLSVTHAAPHWPQELKANMSSFSDVGGIVDPAITGMASRNMDSLVDLQSAVSVFFSEPATYNLIAYAVCTLLLLIWARFSLRTELAGTRIWLALAAIAPLTMLPTYHLQHDAKIIMLAVPACAMLWARRDRIGRLALLVTGAGIVVNGDLFSGVRIVLTRKCIVPDPNFLSRLKMVMLTRPAPLILLGMAIFFLIVFARDCSHPIAGPGPNAFARRKVGGRGTYARRFVVTECPITDILYRPSVAAHGSLHFPNHPLLWDDAFGRVSRFDHL